MIYTVSFKEIKYGSVTVEARSTGEAKILAEQEYSKGNVCWKDSVVDLRSVNREAERGDER